MNDLVEIYSAGEEATDVGKIVYENNKYILIQAVTRAKPMVIYFLLGIL